ncbi:unnamed protein product [Pedinophyceae sp. YPF-701]|nr:unnamed protein product [Pedinophyceae sp. YPF-701]
MPAAAHHCRSCRHAPGHIPPGARQHSHWRPGNGATPGLMRRGFTLIRRHIRHVLARDRRNGIVEAETASAQGWHRSANSRPDAEGPSASQRPAEAPTAPKDGASHASEHPAAASGGNAGPPLPSQAHPASPGGAQGSAASQSVLTRNYASSVADTQHGPKTRDGERWKDRRLEDMRRRNEQLGSGGAHKVPGVRPRESNDLSGQFRPVQRSLRANVGRPNGPSSNGATRSAQPGAESAPTRPPEPRAHSGETEEALPSPGPYAAVGNVPDFQAAQVTHAAPPTSPAHLPPPPPPPPRPVARPVGNDPFKHLQEHATEPLADVSANARPVPQAAHTTRAAPPPPPPPPQHPRGPPPPRPNGQVPSSGSSGGSGGASADRAWPPQDPEPGTAMARGLSDAQTSFGADDGPGGAPWGAGSGTAPEVRRVAFELVQPEYMGGGFLWSDLERADVDGTTYVVDDDGETRRYFKEHTLQCRVVPDAAGGGQRNEVDPEVYCVTDDNAGDAQRVADFMMRLAEERGPGAVFACDTEVANITLPDQSPVGHGSVIALSVYAGADVDFSGGASEVPQDQLWVDLGGRRREEILDALRPFLESVQVRKVWHNYGFDRHVLENEGVALRGFSGDTLHMARLWRTDLGGKEYSLASLTSRADLMGGQWVHEVGGKVGMKDIFSFRTEKRQTKKAEAEGAPPQLTSEKLAKLPAIWEMHTHPLLRPAWIKYSALDAKATWNLYRSLATRLAREPASVGQLLRATYPEVQTSLDVYRSFWLPFGELLTSMESAGFLVNRPHLAEAEERAIADQRAAIETFLAWASRWVPDARLMNISSGQQVGILLFGGIQRAADSVTGCRLDMTTAETVEAAAAESEGESDGEEGPRARGARGAPKEPKVPVWKEIKVPNTDGWVEPGGKRAKVNRPIVLGNLWGAEALQRMFEGGGHPALPTSFTAKDGGPATSSAVLRKMAGKPGAARRLLKDMGVDLGLSEVDVGLASDEDDLLDAADDAATVASAPKKAARKADDAAGTSAEADVTGGERATIPPAYTAEDTPAVVPYGAEDPRLRWLEMSQAERDALDAYAKENGLGALYAAFGGGEEGLRACAAVDALCEVGLIDKLLSSFIRPLQGDDISTPDHRVHCSLNLNTETGRLSARNPNLQNQPALEKDRYKVRAAFCANAREGRSLIVADYGQLELRILAAIAGCESMKHAFEAGGDFHSRTAHGMFQHIKDAVNKGDCRLEEGVGEGGSEVPLIKDLFGSERRMAKILNFSLAYGKTVFGLASDFGQSLTEAQATLDAWYSDRPEVLAWQVEQRKQANAVHYVNTILGRRRHLPDAAGDARRAQGGDRVLRGDAQQQLKSLSRGDAPATIDKARLLTEDPLNWVFSDRKSRGHAFRAAINTPIQGSAADVVTAAMIEIGRSRELRELGWTLLLQVHDEVILEGPAESAERAKEIVGECMNRPFAGHNPLGVDLSVDSNIGQTWYEAK